jgi:Putative beta-barrel porin-2, OmpL-like. bbp2
MKRATSLPIVLTRAFVIFLALAAAIARAEDRPVAATEPAPAPVWPPGLVQEGLSQAGAKGFLDATGTRVYGFVETGFTGRLTGGQEPLPGRLLDARRVNDLRFNQLWLTVDRPYDAAKLFDVGARADVLYGGDAFWTRSLGLNRMGSGNGENWFDPVQFYVQPWLKTGPDSGLEFTIGKFLGTIGYEYTQASLSQLYSHSFLFNTMGPFTVTGVQAKYILNKEWSAYVSVVKGWDDFKDNNHAPSYIAGGCWSSAEQLGGHSRACATANVMTGPEQPGDVNNYRTVVDGSLTYWWTDKFSQALNADWLTEENASPTGGVARSYGVAHYLTYVVDERFTGIWRSEWFRDDSGVRMGTIPASWFEMTWGVNVTPWPADKVLKNLVFRPEFRWDFADQPVFGGGRENQLTLAWT